MHVIDRFAVPAETNEAYLISFLLAGFGGECVAGFAARAGKVESNPGINH